MTDVKTMSNTRLILAHEESYAEYSAALAAVDGRLNAQEFARLQEIRDELLTRLESSNER